MFLNNIKCENNYKLKVKLCDDIKVLDWRNSKLWIWLKCDYNNWKIFYKICIYFFENSLIIFYVLIINSYSQIYGIMIGESNE